MCVRIYIHDIFHVLILTTRFGEKESETNNFNF